MSTSSSGDSALNLSPEEIQAWDKEYESKSAKELIKDLYGINEPFAPRPSAPKSK